jgi:hypothetical protein
MLACGAAVASLSRGVSRRRVPCGGPSEDPHRRRNKSPSLWASHRTRTPAAVRDALKPACHLPQVGIQQPQRIHGAHSLEPCTIARHSTLHTNRYMHTNSGSSPRYIEARVPAPAGRHTAASTHPRNTLAGAVYRTIARHSNVTCKSTHARAHRYMTPDLPVKEGSAAIRPPTGLGHAYALRPTRAG